MDNTESQAYILLHEMQNVYACNNKSGVNDFLKKFLERMGKLEASADIPTRVHNVLPSDTVIVDKHTRLKTEMAE